MKFTVITVFPQIIDAFVTHGLVAQARAQTLIEVNTLNPRQFTGDVHQTVDDRTFGGCDGMVMKVEPLAAAISAARAAGPARVALLTPQGPAWTQGRARGLADRGEHVILVCGRYAGIDHRVHALYADEEISLGDFVLNGGEVAAAAVIESIARLRPGVLGNAKSAAHDSFGEDNLLECPQFTRPREVAGLPVPAPLLSGHHARIAEFERAVGLVRTALRRPELIRRGGHAGEVSRARRLILELNDLELRALGLSRDAVEGVS